MAEPIKRPSTREKRPRSRSAKARLTPPTHPDPYVDLERAARDHKERAKSAKAIRDKHTSSTRVFRARDGQGRFKSMYSQDFDGTFSSPAELRPTSPTRRNNPHPAKQFMVWKLPSREIGGQPLDDGLLLPPEHLARNTDFDAIEDISGGMGRMKLPPTYPTSTDYGAYLHKLPQLKQRQKGGKVYQPVSSDVIDRTVGGVNRDALEDWLATASPEDQHTVLKMLKSAEDAKVKDTINTVMQPEAARAVQGWLQGADDKERDVAVRLFSSLGSRPPRHRSLSESDSSFMRPPSRKPVTPTVRQPRPPGQTSRPLSRGTSAPPVRKPWPAGIWHHKPVRDPPPQVYHRGSVFGAVRGGASHFTVHPEWPDYYAPDDVVH